MDGEIRPNPNYGKESDSVVTIPATFKTAPKSGKSLIYTVYGEDLVLPIKQVVGHSDTHVCITEWIAGKKIEEGKLPPEAVQDGAEDRGDAYEPPPHDDTDIQY